MGARPRFNDSATTWPLPELAPFGHSRLGSVFRTIDGHGRIFETRLTPQSVALVVKRLTPKIGLAGNYAGHSLRSGLATAAAAAGLPERAIMAQTGHKSLVAMRRYIREGSLFLEKVAAKVGL
ncbi:MAG: tyrosine-type recombinase/integrase [Terriglobia bacterium]